MNSRRLIRRAKPAAPGGEPGLSPRAMAELRAMVPERAIRAAGYQAGAASDAAPVVTRAGLARAVPVKDRRFGTMQWVAASVAVVAMAGVGVLVYQGVRSVDPSSVVGASASSRVSPEVPSVPDASVPPSDVPSPAPTPVYESLGTWQGVVPEGAIAPQFGGSFVIPVDDGQGHQGYWGVKVFAMNYPWAMTGADFDVAKSVGYFSAGWFNVAGRDNVYLVQREDGVWELAGPGAAVLPYPLRFTWFVDGAGDPCEYPSTLEANTPFTLIGEDDPDYNRECAAEDMADGGQTFAIDYTGGVASVSGLADYQPRTYYPNEGNDLTYLGTTFMYSVVAETADDAAAALEALRVKPDGTMFEGDFGAIWPSELMPPNGSVDGSWATLFDETWCWSGGLYPNATQMPADAPVAMCMPEEQAKAVNQALVDAGFDLAAAELVPAAFNPETIVPDTPTAAPESPGVVDTIEGAETTGNEESPTTPETEVRG
ncbi:MAG: hypothetical protein LBR19_08335, partial [Bifidobacteriaceae bacterium]|nr:hypothetical protein [Bifidobacteriaceae bacterium]